MEYLSTSSSSSSEEEELEVEYLSEQSDSKSFKTLHLINVTFDSSWDLNTTSVSVINTIPNFFTTNSPVVGLGDDDGGGGVDDEYFIPESFKEMSQLSRNCVIAYCLLFLMAAVGNIYVFYRVKTQLKDYKSRISLLMVHLAVADLLVTFCAMPMEIIWRITIQWYGGQFLCKFCQFLRAFGLYLSSMIVICISVDRYFAIIYPLKLAGAVKRVKRTIAAAWILALICASPQLVVFRVMPHPEYPSFHQCVTETFLRSDVEQEFVYNVFSVSVLYFLPLSVIIFTYTRILIKIYRKSKQQTDQSAPQTALELQPILPISSMSSTNTDTTTNNLLRKSYETETGLKHFKKSIRNSVHRRSTFSSRGSSKLPFRDQTTAPTSVTTSSNGGVGGGEKLKLILRKSNGGGVLMARARIRTLRLTCIIVISFIFCWTPYCLMLLWYMVDREGAKKVDNRIQEALFIMAVSNSVVNPLIYGTYGSNCRSIKSFYNGHCCVTSSPKRCVANNSATTASAGAGALRGVLNCKHNQNSRNQRLRNSGQEEDPSKNYYSRRRSTLGAITTTATTTSLIITNNYDESPSSLI